MPASQIGPLGTDLEKGQQGPDQHPGSYRIGRPFQRRQVQVRVTDQAAPGKQGDQHQRQPRQQHDCTGDDHAPGSRPLSVAQANGQGGLQREQNSYVVDQATRRLAKKGNGLFEKCHNRYFFYGYLVQKMYQAGVIGETDRPAKPARIRVPVPSRFCPRDKSGCTVLRCGANSAPGSGDPFRSVQNAPPNPGPIQSCRSGSSDSSP